MGRSSTVEIRSSMNASDDALRQFGFKVSLDFLETDFKRQQAPRRRIQLKNEANQNTGVPLRKYEAESESHIRLGSFAIARCERAESVGALPLRVPRALCHFEFCVELRLTHLT
jgi:hypothetical protein